MAIDPPPGFRDELLAAIPELDQEIDGLGDLKMSSITPEAQAIVIKALNARSQRRQLILAVITAMDGVVSAWAQLAADGYPTFAPTIAKGTLFAELQSETAAIDTAMKIFTAEPMAEKIVVNLGTPTAKAT